VEPIWLYGYSRPKACDPVLSAWIHSGHLTERLVWQRVELAIESNQLPLATYLKRFLQSSEQPWVDRWIDLHQNPSNPKKFLLESHPYADEIVVDTIKRLVRKDATKALNIWQEIHKDPRFSDQQQLSVARTLASFLALKNDEASLQRLRNLLPAQLRVDPKFSDKLLQVALRQNNWKLVLDIVEGLAPEEMQKEHWSYWHARALSQLGKHDKAEKILKSLSKERSYYGFMAADRLGYDFNFLHETLPVSKTLIDQTASLPGLIRARELLALDRTLEARREWNLALKDKSTNEQQGAAKLASEWNWPSQAILTLAKIRSWNDLELRFPLNYRQQVDQHAKDQGLDSAWVYAIVRQESAFSIDAQSHAGAIGLMQLMPATAKEVASKANNQSFKTNDLFQPDINIELGASYLKQIYRQLQENPILATAAYNAGPSRVINWLPEEPQATDVWIETVPFSETREYLKRVLAYTLIYNHRLGNTPERLPKKWQKPIGVNRLHSKATSKAGSDV
jgi:soluble lytic murein transglycosylase